MSMYRAVSDFTRGFASVPVLLVLGPIVLLVKLIRWLWPDDSTQWACLSVIVLAAIAGAPWYVQGTLAVLTWAVLDTLAGKRVVKVEFGPGSIVIPGGLPEDFHANLSRPAPTLRHTGLTGNGTITGGTITADRITSGTVASGTFHGVRRPCTGCGGPLCVPGEPRCLTCRRDPGDPEAKPA